jgi:hypothetical protein
MPKISKGGLHRLPSRILCLAISMSLAATPLATLGADQKGRIEIPGVYGFLPTNSGVYTITGNAKDADGKEVKCDEWDWNAINPIGGSIRVIELSLSSPIKDHKNMYSFRTGSGEGAARVEVRCKVNGEVVSEGVALVSTKRGEKETEQSQAAPTSGSGGGGLGLGAVAIGLGLAAAAVAAAAAGSGGGGGSSSSSTDYCGSWNCGTQSQCAAVMGAFTGSRRFSSLSACQFFFQGTTFGSSCSAC